MQEQKERILCIEDDEDSVELLRIIFEQEGYTVSTAMSFAEGLQQARGRGFALITIDSLFPDGTGIDLCQQIRAFDADTPILFCSGSALELDQEESIAAGAQAHLFKPVGIEHLREVAAQLMNRVESEALNEESKQLINSSREAVNNSRERIEGSRKRVRKRRS